ncbi:MAG TPA: VWA domain-containing protein [Pyrinomonadaceae bacterium]|jgi:VWFA-related protein
MNDELKANAFRSSFIVPNSSFQIMRLNKIFLLLLVGLFSTTSIFAQQTKPSPTPPPAEEPAIEDDEPLRVEADLVNILFTAADKDRRFLTNLAKDDIRIFEDGKQQQIFTFQRQVDLPLSLAILIDTSVSQERTLPDEKAAAAAFLEDVVRPGKDEVAILTFTGETTLEQGFTNNLSRIRRAVEKVEFLPPVNYAGGGVTFGSPAGGKNTGQRAAQSTAVWNAIWVTADEVMRETKNETRRAIILLSDGHDNNSSKRLEQAVDMALKVDSVVYSIGIGDDYMQGVNQNTLRQIADKTGGRAFFPRDETDLQRAFDQIQNELRSQYLIAYEPSNSKKDGSYRRIEIQVANPVLEKQRVKLTHRQGYFAETENKK